MILPEHRADLSLPDLVLTRRELDALPEYSATLPTGQRIGTRWKRNLHAYTVPVVQGIHPFGDGLILSPAPPPLWIVGEYARHADPELIGIRWWHVRFTDD